MSVFTDCGVFDIDAVRSVKNPTPTRIQVDFADSSGISGVISVVRAIECIQLTVLGNNGVVQRECVEVPYLGKAFVGKPTEQIVKVSLATNVPYLFAVVHIEHLWSIGVGILKGWIIVCIRMQGDLVFLQNPLGVHGNAAFRHGTESVRFRAQVVGVPTEENVVGAVRDPVGGVKVVVAINA